MKLQRHVKTAFAAVLLASLSASGLVGAQVAGDTLKYIVSPGAAQTAQLGGAGDFNSTLTASGYSSEAYNYLQGPTGAGAADDFTNSTGPEIGVANANTFGNNRVASGIDLGSFALQGAPGTDGSVETVVSVTLLLYVTSASITAPDPIISIYAGLANTNGTGGALGTYTLGQSSVGSYLSIDIPYSVAFAGFTIADLINRVPQDSANYGTEENTTLAFQPAYRVNTVYVIPEPSAALLGALGSLTLLRRRRA
jgi:hypothetical protein